MALYLYLKAIPKTRNQKYLLPFSLASLGLFLLINVSLPILVYQLKSRNFRPSLSVAATVKSIDYTQPKDWFPSAPQIQLFTTKITHYNLSIPKLGIKEAVVEVGGEDLSQSLIHYSGTALPGQYGNVVVFGHSVLPQFFNPKNYKTIFSNLPKLERGDEILVDFDGIKYRYQVLALVEVSPEDVSVLEQHYDGEYLSLITCVPPGTYLRRLIVKAGLVAI